MAQMCIRNLDCLSESNVKALITGISGQDGAYLANLLLEKGYHVVGTSRDVSKTDFIGLKQLNVFSKVKLVSCDLTDMAQVQALLCHFNPDEIYNLAAQSSVGASFQSPVDTIKSIGEATLNFLDVIRTEYPAVKYYNAGSSECFGNTESEPASETSLYNPTSPYAVAKANAQMLVRNYREAFGVHACSGILFNHESPLRDEKYVTQKIIYAAAEISVGVQRRLKLGNLAIERDWGWAPEYVNAMWAIMQGSHPDDYVIATGKSVSLRYFLEAAFRFFNLDWEDHTDVSNELFRPADISISKADPSKAEKNLGWRAQITVDDVIQRLCSYAESRVQRRLNR